MNQAILVLAGLLLFFAQLTRMAIGFNEVDFERRDFHRRSLFNKCITDHDCKAHEFCDHTGINPFGSCRTGKELKSSCVFDRHCKSKHCHLMKCVAKKPVKDAPCAPNEHSECIQNQYCSHKEKTYRCRDRSCSGYCLKDVHCISNKCSLFKCKKPESAC